ncbi:hypothetical protein NDU88_005821 [Pleurodeles waltl]|uniref:Uncharacterized protein n=1 Tax=Pleurodeles waltl TaxID=8319 RepID=A0AAV7TBV1_PLEWA|nr:hypothetical protein NDU88_005821 [Pleurodeles waltl]
MVAPTEGPVSHLLSTPTPTCTAEKTATCTATEPAASNAATEPAACIAATEPAARTAARSPQPPPPPQSPQPAPPPQSPLPAPPRLTSLQAPPAAPQHPEPLAPPQTWLPSPVVQYSPWSSPLSLELLIEEQEEHRRQDLQFWLHGILVPRGVSAHQKKGIWHAIAKDVWTLGVYGRRSTALLEMVGGPEKLGTEDGGDPAGGARRTLTPPDGPHTGGGLSGAGWALGGITAAARE